jgi:hypothetical protein
MLRRLGSRGGSRFLALAERFRLLAPKLVFAGAMGALEFEVLAYRVVEDPHAGPD